MSTIRLMIMGGLVLGGLAVTEANAQRVIVYRPVVTPTVAYYAPSAPVVAAPVTTYYRGRVVVRRPVVAYYPPAVAHTTYYAPSVAAVAPVPPTTAYYSPGVVVSPKVYVRGQPVRNVLRAITP